MEFGNARRPHYVLKIFIDTNICNGSIIKKYKKKIGEVQKAVDSYKTCCNDDNSMYVDAGFDLFTLSSTTINKQSQSNCIDHGIKCAMTWGGDPTAFYLYPRSSTGSKTPLRLCNSVGIIDSGYRGSIMTFFDNIGASDYNITSGQRLVQICAPNITYPIYPVLVESVEELGITKRGGAGFGSTGI